MTPSRGLLSSAANGARLHLRCQHPRPCTAQRQFSSRPSPISRLPSIARPALNTSSIRPRLSPLAQPSNTSRAISLWPFGSGSSSSETTPFKDQHKAGTEGLAGSTNTNVEPTASVSSTSPATAAVPDASSSADAAASAASHHTPLDVKLLNIDDITPIVPDPHTLTEKIGHFHELGLNFGWGPSSMIEWMLEHVHVYAGTPWWGSILITAAIVRTAFIPLVIKQSDQMARTQPIKDELDKVREMRMKAFKTNDQGLQLEAMQLEKHLKKTAGLDLKWTFLPILVQLPVGFATFRFMRAAAEVPVPGWETGGFAWITDLSQTDPLMITPVLFFGLMHLMARLGGEHGMTNPPPYLKNVMLWLIPGAVFITMLWMPVALQLSFITSTIFGIGTSFALRKPAVRDYLGIAQMYKKPEPAADDFNAGLRGLNMTPAYQAPRQKPVTIDVPKRNIVMKQLDGISKGMNQAVDDLGKKFPAFARGGADEDKAGRGKAFLQQAKTYEERKRKQIEYEKRNR